MGDIEFLRKGDKISLFSLDIKGFLQSEGFANHDLFVKDNNNTGYVPHDFSRCVFEIVPRLQYKQAKQLRKHRSHLSLTGDRQRQRLLEAVKTESKLNDVELERTMGERVRYGDVIQVRHVKSGRFIEVQRRKAAELETSCLSISLSGDEPTEDCWFTVKPRYQYQSEGDPVRLSAVVNLVCAKTGQEMLRISSSPFPSGSPFREFREVNAGSECAGWKLLLFAQYSPTAREMLQAGDVVRLYQKEEQAWICASPITGGNKAMYEGRPKLYSKKSFTMSATGVDTLWQVEKVTRNVGGPLHFNEEFRLVRIVE